MSAIGSLGSMIKTLTESSPITASIAPLDKNGDEIADDEKAFQYYPETINDTRGVNWVAKHIPGGSHPIYQFISGTDRNISFSTVFTSDENQDSGDIFDKISQGFSLGNLITSIQSTITGKTYPKSKYTVDVAAALSWLRSFTYPTYSTDGYAKAPPFLRLYLPNSGITGQLGGKPTPSSIDVIMTQCDIVYEAFYRQGYPRIAVVNLAFNEVIQAVPGWRFVDREMYDKTFNWRETYVAQLNEHKKAATSGGGLASNLTGFASSLGSLLG